MLTGSAQYAVKVFSSSFHCFLGQITGKTQNRLGPPLDLQILQTFLQFPYKHTSFNGNPPVFGQLSHFWHIGPPYCHYTKFMQKTNLFHASFAKQFFQLNLQKICIRMSTLGLDM